MKKNMFDFDHHSYQSLLRHQDPLEKIFFVGLMISFCLWTPWLMGHIAVIGLMVVGLRYLNKTPLMKLFKLFLIPLSFLMLGVFTIMITVTTNASDLVWSLPIYDRFIGLSQGGMALSLRIFLRSMSCVSCLYYLILTTPFMDLISGFRRLKCPMLLIELMQLMYKMIFLLLDTTQTIHQAQKSRLGYTTYTSSYKDLATLGSMTFIRAFKRADALYTALESRGYSGELQVLDEQCPKTVRGYALPFVIFIGLIILSLVQSSS